MPLHILAGKRRFLHINKRPYITMGIALWKTVPQYLGGRFTSILHIAVLTSCQGLNLKKTKSNSFNLKNLVKPFKAKFTVFHCADPIHLLECVDRCNLSLYALLLVFLSTTIGS